MAKWTMARGTRAKRTFAAAFLALLLPAHAAVALAEDGCSLLQELVTANLYAAATEFAPDDPPSRTGATERPGASTLSGSYSCADTARAASEAFGAVLATLGMPVTWSGSVMNPGNYCFSHDLARCYPSQHPFNPSLPPNHIAFIHDAWTGIRKGVASQMPLGIAADVAQFTPESLDATLASSMKAYVAGPLYSSYQGFERARPKVSSR
jgi:hypothetical protein